ncbi:MAG: GGDEF domain-containing protein [Vogesella sp.]|uniref:GGDEF domain-containing protein n=1 Tax=Vogesella sp. TaxID=1904252 RepID=UPI00391B4BD4
MKAIASLLTEARQRLPLLLQGDESFAEAKFAEHRQFVSFALIIVALSIPSLWLWDLTTDPTHAQLTLQYRAYYLLGLPLGLAFLSSAFSRRTLVTLMALFLLVGIIVFLEILKLLNDGFIHGMPGFMYGMIISILTSQCLPVLQGFLFTLLAVLLPHLYAATGLIEHFPHLRYGVLMWHALSLTLLAQYAIADNYLKRHLSEMQLKHASEHDPLSGLGNRRLLQQRLHAINNTSAAPKCTSLLIIDIDHFKSINDRFGHDNGDLVITHLGRMLQQIESKDSSSYRIGGEEFAILTHLPTHDAEALAEHIRTQAASAQIISRQGDAIPFTISIGLTCTPTPNEAFDILFSRADQALYQAKHQGRNQTVRL